MRLEAQLRLVDERRAYVSADVYMYHGDSENMVKVGTVRYTPKSLTFQTEQVESQSMLQRMAKAIAPYHMEMLFAVYAYGHTEADYTIDGSLQESRNLLRQLQQT